ncbi:hypothetical protein CRUP_026091, partial [Coryphaenoides rupestris]
SKKQRLAVLKKERRKRKRQAVAQARAGDGEHHVPEEEEDEEDVEDICEDEKSGQERQRYHEEWLERERLAQEAFRLRSEREEAARKRQEDEERSIKEEWELQQRKEDEEKEHKQQERKNRELSKPGPWMNPEAPNSGNSENYGTERDVQNCPFFLKTGACRFGDSCNFEPHLRGNVYVQFDTEDQCMEAYQKFNGRWYAGKQLYCELCPVTRWKNAIC